MEEILQTLQPNKREVKKKALIESFANGATITAACESAGITRPTYYSWMETDAEFAAEVTRAQGQAVDVIEDALFETAKKGNVVAQIFFLCNRRSDKWKNVNKIEYEDVTKLPREQLEREYRRLLGEAEKLSATPAGSGDTEGGERSL